MSNNQPPEELSPALVIVALGELIEAIDRRVPQIERVGETGIATEARRLREEAVARIDELRRATPAVLIATPEPD